MCSLNVAQKSHNDNNSSSNNNIKNISTEYNKSFCFFSIVSDSHVLSWSPSPHPPGSSRSWPSCWNTCSSHWWKLSSGVIAGLIGVVAIAQAEYEWDIRSPVQLNPQSCPI